MLTERSLLKLSQFGFVILGAWFAGGLAFSSCQKNQDQQTMQSQDTTSNYHTVSTMGPVDYPTYKTQTEHILAENQDTIASFRARLKNVNAKLKAALDSAGLELERKNEELRATLESYKNQGTENWDKFKSEFDQSMDSIRNNVEELKARIRSLKVEE
ncbi:MAG: hypothetical protein Q8916_04815 [Bacteroidota bacterium]|nr:hypothetical protein [Bacteroidota bacterium]MDP4229709.1 hypothetical protein [Bacteroidota bacterium]MDP4237488.1 hypothetical protein [Bacteroidota bacterium]